MKLTAAFVAMAITATSVVYAVPVPAGCPLTMLLERGRGVSQNASTLEARSPMDAGEVVPNALKAGEQLGEQLEKVASEGTSKTAAELVRPAKTLKRLEALNLDELNENKQLDYKVTPTFKLEDIPHTPQGVAEQLEEIYKIRDESFENKHDRPVSRHLFKQFQVDLNFIRHNFMRRHEEIYKAGRAIHEATEAQQRRRAAELVALKKLGAQEVASEPEPDPGATSKV